MSDDPKDRIAELSTAIAAANDPKEAEATPPVAEETVAPPVRNTEDDDELGEEAETHSGDDPTAPRKNKGVGKRINELTREKHEERRRAEYAEQVARELQQQLAAVQKAPAKVSTGKPTLEQFDYDQEAYFEALADWKAQERLTEFRASIESDQRAKQQAERQTEFQKRIAELEKDVPGAWQEVISAPISTTETMLEVIGDSKIGPRIAYYLTQNLDEADEISRMTPARQAAALGRIEERLQAKPKPAPKTVTNAPAPPPVHQSAARVQTPLADWTIEDHRRYLREKQGR